MPNAKGSNWHIRRDGEVRPEAEETAKDLTALEAFEAVFWASYPKKVAKLAACKAWKSLRLKDDDQITLDRIMEGLERSKRSWADKDRQFIPHPATWLNGRRWEDEE